MKKNYIGKILSLSIIVLFIGMSVIPSTGSTIDLEKSSRASAAAIVDAPLPPLLWTEDFSTFYVKIPDKRE